MRIINRHPEHLTRRYIKNCVRTGVVDDRLPKWAKKVIDDRRKRLNREALKPEEELQLFLREMQQPKRVARWLPANSLKGKLIIGLKNRLNRKSGWMIKFEEFLKDWLWSD